MKLGKILIAAFVILVATACTVSTSRQKEGATVQAGSGPKQVVLEVSTIT